MYCCCANKNHSPHIPPRPPLSLPTAARFPQIFLAARQLRLQSLRGRFQCRQRLTTWVPEFACHILIRFADGFVHIPIGDGLRGAAAGVQRWGAGAVHQGATVLGAAQQTDAHGEAFDLWGRGRERERKRVSEWGVWERVSKKERERESERERFAEVITISVQGIRWERGLRKGRRGVLSGQKFLTQFSSKPFNCCCYCSCRFYTLRKRVYWLCAYVCNRQKKAR